MSSLRVHLDSIGCRLNQAEIERLASQLRAAGHTLVPTPEACDWAVLNTCTVTGRADADSRARLRRIHRRNPLARVAVTGCWSTVHGELAATFPGVVHVVANGAKDGLVALLGDTSLCASEDLPPRAAIPGGRRRARAFLAVQDGCDQACAFCLTTVARGSSRSVPTERVLAELNAAEAGGASEVVLCGVQLAAWGRDLPGSPQLGQLLDAVLASAQLARVRLSSLEPWGLVPGLLDRWAQPGLCPQLHLPLQAGCDATLARMGRPHRRSDVDRIVRRARASDPGIAITADILVGFPGETPAEFSEGLVWFEQLGLADAHVFTFSPRPGTRAAKMPDPIDVAVARERRLRVLGAVDPSRRSFRRGLVGRTVDVVWVASTAAAPGRWGLRGITEHGVPVVAEAGEDRWASRERAEVVSVDDDGGVVVFTPPR